MMTCQRSGGAGLTRDRARAATQAGGTTGAHLERPARVHGAAAPATMGRTRILQLQPAAAAAITVPPRKAPAVAMIVAA